MVTALAFLATAVATVFAETMLVRSTRRRRPHEAAWAVSLGLFALACVALSLGVSTGWDTGTFRVFYLFGAILNVPWLALGTIYLTLGERTGRRLLPVLLVVSGLAAGAVLAAPTTGAVAGRAIPVGKEVFGPLPRILAGACSALGATVVVAGALGSALRLARARRPAARLAAANGIIALGVLVLSGGGLVQGVVGHDVAFTASLALGIATIYVGFLVAGGASRRAPGQALDGPAARAEPAPVGR